MNVKVEGGALQASLQVKVDGDALDQALHAAILQALGDNAREMIVKEAVRYLTTPRKDGYGVDKDVSPIVGSVRRACERIATDTFTERLLADEAFRAELEGIYVDAVKTVFGASSREAMVARLGDKIREAFSYR